MANGEKGRESAEQMERPTNRETTTKHNRTEQKEGRKDVLSSAYMEESEIGNFIWIIKILHALRENCLFIQWVDYTSSSSPSSFQIVPQSNRSHAPEIPQTLAYEALHRVKHVGSWSSSVGSCHLVPGRIYHFG